MSKQTEIELVLTPRDLQIVTDDARQFWIHSDAGLQLPNTGKSLTESEHRAVSWVQAIAGLLRRKLNEDHHHEVPEVKVRLDSPDLEPDTEP